MIGVERREVWKWDGTIVVIIIVTMIATTAPSSSATPTAVITLVTISVGPVAVIAIVAASILLNAVRLGGSQFIIRRIMKIVAVLATTDLSQLAAAALTAVLVAVHTATSLMDAALADNAMLGAAPADAALTVVFALTDFAAHAAAALAFVFAATTLVTILGRGDGGKGRTRWPGGIDGGRG